MRPRVVEGEACQCGRPVHELKGMRLCECAVHPAFCRCAPVGLVNPKDVLERWPGTAYDGKTPLSDLLEDVRRNW